MSLFSMHKGQTRARMVQAGVAFAVAAFVAGCGAGYRPVVSPVNPTGPAAQPSALAVVISVPSPTSPGIASIIDYSGDTIVAQARIGVNPSLFTVDETGTSGYTVNSDGTVTNFQVSPLLQEKYVLFTTLPSTAQPISLFSPSAGVSVSDLTGNVADILIGSPATFKIAVPVAATPVLTVGASVGGTRDYVITQGAVASGVTCNTSPSTGPVGEADAIETSNFTISARIPLGVCPTYAVQSPDGRRLFVLNRGDDTLSVINSQNY